MVLCLPTSFLALCPGFIDGQGCLLESIDYKPGLVKSPAFLDTSWRHGGSHYDLVASIEECFNNYADASRKIHGFDKYEDISAKDNERMWRASEVVINYDLSVASHLDRCNYEKQIQWVKTCQCDRYLQSCRDYFSENRCYDADMTSVLVWSECDRHT